MKKLLVLALLLALLLTGCGAEKKGMQIEKAKLTRAEENLARLLGTAHGNELLYDFSVDENVESLQINAYELIDGQWQLFSGGGGLALNAKSGRIALSFEKLGEGLRTAIQTGDDVSASEFKSAEPLENPGSISMMACDRSAIEYDVEIPIALQILS